MFVCVCVGGGSTEGEGSYVFLVPSGRGSETNSHPPCNVFLNVKTVRVQHTVVGACTSSMSAAGTRWHLAEPITSSCGSCIHYLT